MTKRADCWAHIILEGYCFRTLSDKKHKHDCELIDGKSFKTKKILNPRYDPDFRTPRKPSYCPGKPRYICLEKQCPHFCFCEAEKEDYLFLNAKYDDKLRKKAFPFFKDWLSKEEDEAWKNL